MNVNWRKERFLKKRDVSKVKSYGIEDGVLHLNFNTRNVLASLTTLEGRVLNFFSSGMLGFKHAKKKTSLAVEETVRKVLTDAVIKKVRNVHVKVKGFSYSRSSALKQLNVPELNVLTIEDKTYIKFAGCRPQKAKKH